MTDFKALHPKIKGLFDGFYTDLEEFRRKKIHFRKISQYKEKSVFKFSFWEKIVCVCLTVRCTGILKKPVGIYGGDILTDSTPTRADERVCCVQLFRYTAVCRHTMP